jgi:hypothetical protein
MRRQTSLSARRIIIMRLNHRCLSQKFLWSSRVIKTYFVYNPIRRLRTFTSSHHVLDIEGLNLRLFFSPILPLAVFEFLHSVLVEHLQPRHERLRYGLPNPDVC